MLSSRQYLSDLRDFFFEHPLMNYLLKFENQLICNFFSEQLLIDYPAQVRKSANLHIQDGRHRLIFKFKIDVNALQSSLFI